MSTVKDLLLNDGMTDLYFGYGRLGTAEGLLAVAQRQKVRFGTWRGEIWRDTSKGINYREEIFVRDPDLTYIDAVFREVILTTPTVVGLTNFNLVFDGNTRTLSLSYKAQSTEGEITVTTAEGVLHPALLILLFELS